MDTSSDFPKEKSLAQIVADRVAQAVKGIGQVEFARRTGRAGDGKPLSQSTISRVISGEQQVTIPRLEKLAKACGVQPYEMLLDSDTVRRAVVERFLSPALPPPQPVAQPSRKLPASRTEATAGQMPGRAVDEVALPSVGGKTRPPTAHAEIIPGRRTGARRSKRKRQ